MTKKTVDELPTIGDTQEENAQTILQQNGITFKGRERPNPINQINITSEAQLVAEFGAGIDIPDFANVKIVLDDNISLSIPIKRGIGTSLTLEGATAGLSLTYTGTGDVFQNSSGAMIPPNLPNELIIRNLKLVGDATAPDAADGTNTALNFFQLGPVILDTVEFNGFAKVGPLGAAAFIADLVIVSNTPIGIILNGVFGIDIDTLNLFNPISGPLDVGTTLLSIIGSPFGPVAATVNNLLLFNLSGGFPVPPAAGESCIFFDPNVLATSSLTISNSPNVQPADFFQPGSKLQTEATDSVGNPGSVEYNTLSKNELVVGDRVTISGFATAAYNGTFTVTVHDGVGKFETGVAFDITEGFVGLTENMPIEISGVTDIGGGTLEFTTFSVHDLVVGRVVRLTDFTSYNGTFVISAVPTTSTFRIDNLTFGVTETGFARPKSLDSIDVPVNSQDNVGTPDSMFTAEAGLELFGSEQVVTINTISVPEVIPNAAWAYTRLERFIEGVATEGQVIAQDIGLRRYSIAYSATIERVGGGSQTLGIVIFKNGVDITFNAPITVNTGKIQITGSDIIELTLGDTLQIAVVNLIDTNDIDVSQVSLVINRA